MKLFLLIPYIASLINSSPILNQNNQTNSTDFVSVVNNLKQCYQCDFSIEDFTNASRLFNDNCINQTVNCNNNFCSLLLTNNKYDNKYAFKLGCISENYCSNLIEENTSNNHINCCDSNLCNNAAFTRKLLTATEFIINKANTTYIINNNAPANQTISSDAIIGAIADNISFPQDYLGKLCLYHTFFIDDSKHIITLKRNNCNNKNTPFTISPPINKIIFLDTNQQIVNELLSSDKGIYSVNYAEDKKLLCFISGNYVFIYKVDDDNKQLTEVNRIYLPNKPVDISINHQKNILAIANKDTVIFYNIVQTEQTEKVILIENTKINGYNIYRVQYNPKKDILLVETQTPDNLRTAVYNVKNLNNIKFIGITPAQERKTNLKNIRCFKYNKRYYTQDCFSIICNTKQGNKNTKVVLEQTDPYEINTTSKSYYSKWIIAPTDNFMINNRIIFTCPPLLRSNYIKEEQYSSYSWNKQINNDDYSVSDNIATNLDMFANRIRSKCQSSAMTNHRYNELSYTTDIMAIYDYFFSTNNNLVLAIIGKENPGIWGSLQNKLHLHNDYSSFKKYLKWRRAQYRLNINNRYLYFKKFTNINTNNNLKTILRKLPTIVRYRLFDLAHTGVFNNDSSKLAVFSDNKMRVYAINLPPYKQQTTTAMPTTEDINTEKQTTSLPTSQSTTTKKQTTNSILTTLSSELANSLPTTNTNYPPINEDKNNNLKTKQNNIIQENPMIFIGISIAAIVCIVITVRKVKIIKHNKRKKRIIRKLLTGEASTTKAQ